MDLKAPPDGDVVVSKGYMAGLIVLTVFAAVAAWLRMYTRISISRKTGADDWTMFVASV